MVEVATGIIIPHVLLLFRQVGARTFTRVSRHILQDQVLNLNANDR